MKANLIIHQEEKSDFPMSDFPMRGNKSIELELDLNVLEAKALIEKLQSNIDVFETSYWEIQRRRGFYDKLTYNEHAANTSFFVKTTVCEFKELKECNNVIYANKPL